MDILVKGSNPISTYANEAGSGGTSCSRNSIFCTGIASKFQICSNGGCLIRW